MDFVEEALSSAEIKAEFRDNPGRLESLRTELLDGEAELTGTVSAERKHWQDAAKRAANPRDAVQADKKDVKTPFYRFVFLPMLGVLVISFGSAVLCLFVGYVVASSRPSLASWQSAGWIPGGSVRRNVRPRYIPGPRQHLMGSEAREGGLPGRRVPGLDRLRGRAQQATARGGPHLDQRQPGAVPRRQPAADQALAQPGRGVQPHRLWPGEASKQLKDMIRQLSGGGTIGLAGPRGAGKTSLIREHEYGTRPLREAHVVSRQLWLRPQPDAD